MESEGQPFITNIKRQLLYALCDLVKGKEAITLDDCIYHADSHGVDIGELINLFKVMQKTSRSKPMVVFRPPDEDDLFLMPLVSQAYKTEANIPLLFENMECIAYRKNKKMIVRSYKDNQLRREVLETFNLLLGPKSICEKQVERIVRKMKYEHRNMLANIMLSLLGDMLTLQACGNQRHCDTLIVLFEKIIFEMEGYTIDIPLDTTMEVFKYCILIRWLLETTQCVCCHIVTKTSLCGRCKSVRYCSVECQKQHWPVHSKECEDKHAQ